MESNRPHTETVQTPLPEFLQTQIRKEKEALVTMFLANASISQLAEQYKRIDDLHEKMNVPKNSPI